LLREEISESIHRYKTDNEIYHDLMEFRVREILLVATLYDAFILEQEDKLSEKIFGEYYQLNLSTAPRITSVSCSEDALTVIAKKHFDSLGGKGRGMAFLNMLFQNWELSTTFPGVNIRIPPTSIIGTEEYDYFPLGSALKMVMEIIRSVMGTSVEIEFAVDLNKDGQGNPSLYILPIKPLLGNLEDYNLELAEINRDELFLYTEKAMGNGRINDLYDIIYVDPDSFDKTKTVEMAAELEKLNTTMKKEQRKYLLIGPGRWGSRDRWPGIPVLWSHISNARIIVEVGLEDYRIDPSLGSHFFHNVTSMNIGYFDILYGSDNNFIDWQWLKGQIEVPRSRYFIHVRFDKSLVAKMDGRKSISVVYKPAV